MPSNHLILCCPLLLLPSIFPNIRIFSNESALHITWPKYWSFSISPYNEHPVLISFRMDWLELLAIQGTLNSLLQHHNSKASILWHSAFFIVQLSHPYMTTGKTIALTRQTFVDKVMSLHFNMLSSLVITFLPRSKCLLISWLQSPSAMITITSMIIMKKCEIRITKYDTETWSEHTVGKNGVHRLAQHRVVTVFQVMKNMISTKRNKTRYASIEKMIGRSEEQD